MGGTSANAEVQRSRASTLSKIGRFFTGSNGNATASTNVSTSNSDHHQSQQNSSSDSSRSNSITKKRLELHRNKSNSSLVSHESFQTSIAGSHLNNKESLKQVNAKLNQLQLNPPDSRRFPSGSNVQTNGHLELPTHTYTTSSNASLAGNQVASNNSINNSNTHVNNVNNNSNNNNNNNSAGAAANPLSSTISNTNNGGTTQPAVAATFSRTSSMRKAGAKPNQIQPRFKIIGEGGIHEHYLKVVKRQEKLGQMVKDWIGGTSKKRSEAVSAVPNIFSMNTMDEMNNQVKAVLNGAKEQNLPPTLFAMYMKDRNNVAENSDELKSLQQVTSIKLKDGAESHLENFVEKYGKCQEVIGRGTFGIVRVAHKKVNDKEVLYAVKEFTRKHNESDKKYSTRLTNEFCISSSLKHLNIISAFDLFKDSKGDYCEVMEYCQGGDLYSLIITAGKLEYAEADCFFKQLLRAVHYMHNMGVSHRDLKPENILLTHNGTIKITDFGNAECFKMAWEDEIQFSHGISGSSPYIAPEEYTDDEFDARCVDVWACGVIYMAMRTGRQLWQEARKEDQFFGEYLKKRKAAKGYEPIEMLKRARCRNVIYSILDPIPSRRITSLQILKSEWVREISCCKN